MAFLAKRYQVQEDRLFVLHHTYHGRPPAVFRMREYTYKYLDVLCPVRLRLVSAFVYTPALYGAEVPAIYGAEFWIGLRPDRS